MTRTGKFIRFLGCVAIAVMTVELCARVDDSVKYGAPIWSSYNIDQIYEFDAIGRRGKPNAGFRKWQLNSLGYRGPELTSGASRLVTMGASETFGLYESPGKEFPRQLQDELNRRAGRHSFDVINTAYAGMPLHAMIQRVPEIAQRLHPGFAVIYPTPSTYIWLRWLRPELTPAPPPAFESRIAQQVKTLAKTLVPVSLQNVLRAWQIEREAPRYGQVMERLPEENIERFATDLRALTTALKSYGVEPVCLTHANRFHDPLTAADRDGLIAWRKFYPMLSENGFIDMENRMNDAVRAIAAEGQCKLIDTALQVPPGSEYFADFTHFTDEGSKKMAEALANELLPVITKCCEPAPQSVSRRQP